MYLVCAWKSAKLFVFLSFLYSLKKALLGSLLAVILSGQLVLYIFFCCYYRFYSVNTVFFLRRLLELFLGYISYNSLRVLILIPRLAFLL